MKLNIETACSTKLSVPVLTRLYSVTSHKAVNFLLLLLLLLLVVVVVVVVMVVVVVTAVAVSSSSKNLKEEIDSKCQICTQHEETIDQLTSEYSSWRGMSM
jgi:Trk-type K+ transport system membrane component